MPTTSDYLTQLQQDREDLVDNLETKGITGLTGNETFTELVPEVLNIPSGGGVDLNDYFLTTIPPQLSSSTYGHTLIKKVNEPISFDNTITSLAYLFNGWTSLEKVPSFNGTTSQITSCQNMFNSCEKITELNFFDTSNVTTFSGFCSGCKKLETIPLFTTTKVTTFQNAFRYCYELSNTSLDYILQMCRNSNVTSASRKKLSDVFGGDMSTYYPTSLIQALPHYQDFINAGWTIGY